ncbi:MAG: UvrD-helicase domain-containing protein [Muribaculaceae bacterium]|nr:UvrD-helicase domain-containing protein [Muribaculaceae bacterium]
MLQLQRASAGSGKTFTLAKKFIWFLIAIKEDGKPWRLRTPREIADGLGRILAITFTNKATNEMKQRIVAKLADLSRAADEPVTNEMLSSVAYLKDFSSDLNVSPQNIGIACKEALSALLNDYSAFRVSTIDSFFQSILRTFAYESNLNDSYQVEIDSDYLATAAIDATLDTVDNRGQHGSAAMWLRLLMDDAASTGSQWNVFQKSETPQSIYTRLRRSIQRLESEEFKGVRKELDGYFDTDNAEDPLAKAYITLKKEMEAPLKEALEEAQSQCSRLASLLRDAGINPKEDCQRWFDSHIKKLPLLRFNDQSSKPPFKPLAISDSKPLLKKGVSSPLASEINRTAAIMYEAYSMWLEKKESNEWRHWCVYAPLLPYLGLLGEARNRMAEYLEANNMIQLGETNSMLKRIIGEDDTPFIYERLGTAINHYLIDEFQDTSRMQWDNLHPLLAENDSRGQDNLIIGDAKQSIYRFRNADPSLITTSVPEAFPRHVAAGMNRADNTNWRSDRRIVEFNNFFFKALVDKISELGKGTLDFRNLYSNVAQYPSHREEKGYVEIRFLDPDLPADCSDEVKETEDSPLSGIPPLIYSLLERGYNCRDIAILVDTNQLGKDVIASIVAFNASLPAGKPGIDFISEESLLVSSAEAVGIIISVLRKLIWGCRRDTQEEVSESVHHDWDDIRSNFSFYSLRHPEQSVAEQICGFLNEDSPEDAINRMLSTMQTVALPALVEAITENFIPVNLRRSQAVFIAALQDMVLEYCERYAADVASFLNWWDSKGKDRSISSPEGTDAVQIMTVHKSKGLEFKCVIMPSATASLTPLRKSEWRWVRPASCFAGAGLPPFVPVETTSALEQTEHADIYRRYFDLYMMDRLNSIYVAFTRAVSELYIITRMPRRPDTGLASYLKEICGNADDYLRQYMGEEDSDCLLPDGLSRWNDTGDIISFGEKPEVTRPGAATDKDLPEDELVIEEYGVDSSPSILQYVEGDIPTPPASVAELILDTEDGDTGQDTGTVTPEAADTDPRSEGNLLHSVMGMVSTSKDLHKAILAMKTRGLITRSQASEWEQWLSEAIAKEEVKEWFEGKWRVMNERPILIPRSSDRRPDRIMVSQDRKQAIILDYKFGSDTHDRAYRKQVREYIKAFREASGIRDIKGYLWYVRADRITEV